MEVDEILTFFTHNCYSLKSFQKQLRQLSLSNVYVPFLSNSAFYFLVAALNFSNVTNDFAIEPRQCHETGFMLIRVLYDGLLLCSYSEVQRGLVTQESSDSGTVRWQFSKPARL